MVRSSLAYLGLGLLLVTPGLAIEDDVAFVQRPSVSKLFAGVEDAPEVKPKRKQGMPELAMVHVPCNFGHTIERDALKSPNPLNIRIDGLGKLPSINALRSFRAKDKSKQWSLIESAKGDGGQIWGMMDPDLREISSVGCRMYYTPSRYWPADLADRYYRKKIVFGVLRDPFDRMVNEFRMQAHDVSSVYEFETRHDVSLREGTSMDREGSLYKSWYDNCDVNAWVQRELRHYKHGDRFRGNCHLLPQAEFFTIPYGINAPVDARTIPDSFNHLMKLYNYDIRMANGSDMTHNKVCKSVTAWSLDEASKKLIREVYAKDFELVCKSFGYCDQTELTCIKQVPDMCGLEESDVELMGNGTKREVLMQHAMEMKKVLSDKLNEDERSKMKDVASQTAKDMATGLKEKVLDFVSVPDNDNGEEPLTVGDRARTMFEKVKAYAADQ